MGKRGPAPKPTVLRVLEGNPSHRPLNKREPKPRIATPTPPAGLDKAARAHWNLLIAELERIPSLLTAVDGGVLAMICQAHSEWEQADAIVQESGLTINVKDGQVWPHPAVKIRDVAAKRYKALAAEYGLTPSSRSRINLPKPSDEESDGILS